jgi:quercetin dioxygenase-like cupin family protein
MATRIYDPCTNPISGESFQAISFDEKAYTMQWTVQAKGYVPFEHIHINQDEIFHVRQGELKILLNGVEYIGTAGESITVPKGVAHIASNNKNEMLDCVVEYRPGLDHDKFMQCLVGLTLDNYLDKKGGIDIPRMGYFLTKMKAKCMARPTEIPALLFNVALKVFYLRGVLSGWNKLFIKYTDGK